MNAAADSASEQPEPFDDDGASCGDSPFRVGSPSPGRVEVHGEVDAATAPLLYDALLEAATLVRDDVVLDLTGLTFIDSSGLSVLVTTHQRLSSESRTFVVHQPPASARRLFEIAGLDRVLTIT